MRLMELPIKDVLSYTRRFREINCLTAIEKLKDLYALMGDDLECAKFISLVAFYWFNRDNKPLNTISLNLICLIVIDHLRKLNERFAELTD